MSRRDHYSIKFGKEKSFQINNKEGFKDLLKIKIEEVK